MPGMMVDTHPVHMIEKNFLLHQSKHSAQYLALTTRDEDSMTDYEPVRGRHTEPTCPEHTKLAIDNWVQKGWWPGSFVEAVLQNNLFEAIAYADDINRVSLVGITRYVYNDIPSPAWGSRETMLHWAEALRVKEEARQEWEAEKRREQADEDLFEVDERLTAEQAIDRADHARDVAKEEST